MTRKDTILIAVVINAGLLAVLLATAVIYDPDEVTHPKFEQNESTLALGDQKPNGASKQEPASSQTSAVQKPEELLNYQTYAQEVFSPQFITEPFSEPVLMHAEKFYTEVQPVPDTGFIEVTVKRGDVLEKIARANGTTIALIKQANQLKTEKLSIGQVLKIPAKRDEQPTALVLPAGQKQATASLKENNADPVYYTLKAGDSPWKVAKQHHVKFEELLQLNQLDEEKARNLKVGDRIRVK